MLYLPVFHNLCPYLYPTDRPIIRETKQLRVGLGDFDVKSQIGNGYFGEVHVSLFLCWSYMTVVTYHIQIFEINSS